MDTLKFLSKIILIITVCIGTIGFVAYTAFAQPAPVQAQVSVVEIMPATEIPDYCVLTSKIGVIENYFCQPDFGPAYVANNAGFVQVVD